MPGNDTPRRGDVSRRQSGIGTAMLGEERWLRSLGREQGQNEKKETNRALPLKYGSVNPSTSVALQELTMRVWHTRAECLLEPGEAGASEAAGSRFHPTPSSTRPAVCLTPAARGPNITESRTRWKMGDPAALIRPSGTEPHVGESSQAGQIGEGPLHRSRATIDWCSIAQGPSRPHRAHPLASQPHALLWRGGL